MKRSGQLIALLAVTLVLVSCNGSSEQQSISSSSDGTTSSNSLEETSSEEASSSNASDNSRSEAAISENSSSSEIDYSLIYEAHEMVNVALEKYKSEEHYCAVAVGNTQALMVNQGIFALHIKNGGRYFEESISRGMVNVFDRMWEEGDSTTTRWGDHNDYSSMEEKAMSNDEYAAIMGRKVSDLSSYIVNADTVLFNESKSGKETTSITKTETGYTVELELDPDKATENYKTQMQTISSLYEKPSFEYCHLTFYLNESLYPLSSISYEKYYARMNWILGSDCEGRLETKYQWGKETTIPEFESTDDYYDNFDTFVTGEVQPQ